MKIMNRTIGFMHKTFASQVTASLAQYLNELVKVKITNERIHDSERVRATRSP